MGGDSSKPTIKLNDGEMILDRPLEEPGPSFVTLSELKRTLEIGDIVAVRRDRITHYMVYIGGHKEIVIHFYARGNEEKKDQFESIMDYMLNRLLAIDSKADKDGEIALETIDAVMGSDKCAIDNRAVYVYAHLAAKGERTVVRTQQKIVFETQTKFESAVRCGSPKYNLYHYNCETFALELRYGVPLPSLQAHGKNDFMYRCDVAPIPLF